MNQDAPLPYLTGLNDRDIIALHAFAVRADLPAFRPATTPTGHRYATLDFGHTLGIDSGRAVWTVDRHGCRVVAYDASGELASGDRMADVLIAISALLPRRVEAL